VLALAILRAFVETRRRIGVADRTISTVPRLTWARDTAICCDNFA
jgi:hypothetical protein